MAQKVNLLKTNFTGGVVSRLAYGRTDVARNQNGLAECHNFIVQPHGGVCRRMGTVFVSEVRDSSKKSRQIPFEFNEEEAYVIEFCDNTIRFIKNRALVLSAGTPYTVSSPYSENELEDLDYAQSGDVIYLTHKNHAPRTLARFSDNNWVLAEAVLQDGPYRGVQYTDKDTTLWITNYGWTSHIKSTVAEFSSGDIGKYVEYYDEGFLVIAFIASIISSTVVATYPVQNVVDFASIDKSAVLTYATGPARVRSTLAIWSTETENSYIKVGGTWRYLTTHSTAPEQVTAGAISYSTDVMFSNPAQDPTMKTTTGVLSVVYSIVVGQLNANSPLFSAGRDEGRHFRLTLGANNVWGYITSVSNPYACQTTLGTYLPLDYRDRSRLLNNAQTNNWRLGAFYVGNYPSVVTIHQQRLIFASTAAEKNRVFVSMIDDFVSFATANKFAEVLDTSGINFTVGTGEVNPIRWMQSGPVLLIGTQGEEFQIKPGSISEPLSPTNISITQQTPYGSRQNIRPIKIGSATLFVQRHGVSMREMVYNFEIDSFTAADMTIVAEHVIRKNGFAVSMCYQQIPNSILWVTCSNGKLLSFTYEKEHQVFAWAEHEIKDGFIESICRIPNASENKDEVYLIVRRTINGATRRYHEYMANDFQPVSDTDKSGMIYVDSAKTYSGSPTNTITGLNHLEGKEVTILADESVHPPRTVISGAITLDYAASRVIAGLGFVSYIKTLPMEGGSPTGTAMGKLKKLHRVDIQLLSTIGLKYGRNYPNPDSPMTFIEPNPIMGQSPDLFTGFLELRDDSGFNQDGQFYIVQDQCYPCNILALMPIVVVNE